MKTALSAAIYILLSSLPALAQTQPFPNVPPLVTAPTGTPSFFVTSVGLGKGGDLGGLDGADKHCQALATAAGIGAHTWRAYLSTQAANGQPAINARDRIGNGPWFSTKGSQIATNLADLHGDTVELARKGNLISKSSALTEKGEVLPGEGEKPNYHDVLTGSQTDGRAYAADSFDHTCRNWTSSLPDSSAQVGHSDRNSSSHKHFMELGAPKPGLHAGQPDLDRRQRAVLLFRCRTAVNTWRIVPKSGTRFSALKPTMEFPGFSGYPVTAVSL